MKLTTRQRREISDYVAENYATKERSHFCERFGITRRQYDNFVRQLKDQERITAKAQRKVLDRDQLTQMARAWWTMAQDGPVDRAALREMFGLAPRSQIKKILERFLDQVGAGDLIDYEKQSSPELRFGVPPMGAEFTPGARLAAMPWRPDYSHRIGQIAASAGSTQWAI